MTPRSVIYWTATTIIALAFLSGGVAYLAQSQTQLDGMAALGYPAYFVTLLGFWKVAGGAAILSPRLPLVKEWAYAGIAFDLTGAAFSQGVVTHSPVKIITPLVLLVVAAASWALRPANRVVAGRAPMFVQRASPDDALTMRTRL